MEHRLAKVLVVDDEPGLLSIIGQFLEGNGVEFELADSVAQARKFLENAHFDVVISDLNMPGESGFDLYHYISSHFPKSKFVLMTGCIDAGLKQKAGRMGIEYIEKPFSMFDLMQFIVNPHKPASVVCQPEVRVPPDVVRDVPIEI